ncbi:PIN domain-containing protein [Actinokineospora diospyrosa]|uniref:PIN domain-containing protein n=1 Tax=Actinokineospora diospyrosa TaxID=103728 RepID=A0ABT1I871_9PSEU|nr:PIN domain-containing protein [Actinokineospora diospyrosa]MCP2268591.1 PIN domain-containing protein [Actinokineospora diospyrosa]
MFAALLDTCVLWPSRQRDFLLSLAIEGLYRPLWSGAILEELEYEEARKLVERGFAPEGADRRARNLILQMRQAFNDAEVVGWEALVGSYGLPDPDDEHVVAAAAFGHAGALVTHNIKDFPEAKMPNEVQVVTPSTFASNTVALSPTRALVALEQMASRSGANGPKMDVRAILAILKERYKMHDAVGLIWPLLP